LIHKGINYLNLGNEILRIIDPNSGKSLVIDKITNEIILLGKTGFKF